MADKPVKMPQVDETAIAEQAARWHAILKSAGSGELKELSAWLRMSPRHGYHFLCATTVDRLLERIDPDKTKFNPHAWVKEAQENVVTLHATAETPQTPPAPRATLPSSRNRFRLSSVAAGVAALALGLGAWLLTARFSGWKDFSTRTAEPQSVQLEEGSIIHLDSGSQVRVRLTPAVRDIDLTRGEALFKVQHDPRRPFRVHAAGNLIQAIGTQFTVDVRNQTTAVSVIEGTVRVTPLGTGATVSTLTAGERLDIGSSSRRRQDPAKTPAAVGSLQRRLIFHADALADMAAEFNRYNLAPKFRLEGIDGHARHYTGTFDADDPDSFASVLSQEKVYSIERTPQEIIVREPRTP